MLVQRVQLFRHHHGTGAGTGFQNNVGRQVFFLDLAGDRRTDDGGAVVVALVVLDDYNRVGPRQLGADGVVKFSEEQVSAFEFIQAEFTRCRSIVGYASTDTEDCFNLALELGMLIPGENNEYSFCSDDLRTCFEMEAYQDGLAELMMDAI